MVSNSKPKFDKIDKKIITLLQKDPALTHDEIAQLIQRSQPTVGIRLRKLLKTNMFGIQPGINFKAVDIHMARVRMDADCPERFFNVSKLCPYVLNCFLISGDYNLFMLLVSTDLKYIDSIVNDHYRIHEDIKKVEMDIVVDIANDLILPVKFKQQEEHNPINPDQCIKECPFCTQESLI
ncbi:MAG: putative HTH-type transcriptional regulator LrpA [Promethearchaeota archaeon]|nr:MAG: putative HTH-type transcriptional regulator LrpA [Candidatus Lokiarchaeota archaeon]